jgi:hypothetical protein
MDYGSNNNTLSLTGGDNIDDITDTLLNLANTTSNNQTLINNNTLLINDVSSSLNTLDIQVQDISGSLDTLDTQVQSLSNSVDGKANDADVVKLTGDQSIAGNKLFTEDITIHKGLNSRPKLILSGETNTRQYGGYIAYEGALGVNDLEIGTINNYADVKLLWADVGSTTLKCVGDIRAYAGSASEISMLVLDTNVGLALSRSSTALNQISTINGITIPNVNSVIDDLSSNHYTLNDVVVDLSTNFYTTEHGANIINISNTLTDLSGSHYALQEVVVDLSTNFYVLTGTTIPNINLVIDDLSSNHYALYNVVVDLCGNVATNINNIADISGLVQTNISNISSHNTRISAVEDTLQDLQDELDAIDDDGQGGSIFDAIFGTGTVVSLATVASLAYQAYTIAAAAAASAATANSTNATQALEIDALETTRQFKLVDSALPNLLIETNEAGIYNITSSGLIDANDITASDISATTISANGFSSTTGYGTGNTQITPSYTDIYSATTTISGETINITGNTAVNVNGNINLNGNNITGVNVLGFSGSAITGLDTLSFKTATGSNASISNLKSVAGDNFTIQADGDAIFGSKTISTLQTATQVGTLITTAINALVGNAGSGYDTLVELQNEIENNDLSLNEVFTNVATKVSKSGDTMTGLLNLRNGDNGDYLRFNGERSWLWYSTSSEGSTDLRLKDEWNGKEWKYVTNNDTVWAKWKFDNTLSNCKLEFLGGKILMSNNTEIDYKGQTLDDRFVKVVGDTMTGNLTINNNLSIGGSTGLTFTNNQGQITANSNFFDIGTNGTGMGDYNLRVENTTSIFKSGLQINGSTGLSVGGDLSVSVDLSVGGDLSIAGNPVVPIRDWEMDLSSQSTTYFYPVVFEPAITNYDADFPTIEFEIFGESLGASNSYNEQTIKGYVRVGGWTDHSYFYEFTNENYDVTEQRISQIWRGTTISNTFAVYVRGGYKYTVRTNAGNVPQPYINPIPNQPHLVFYSVVLSGSTYSTKNLTGADSYPFGLGQASSNITLVSDVEPDTKTIGSKTIMKRDLMIESETVNPKLTLWSKNTGSLDPTVDFLRNSETFGADINADWRLTNDGGTFKIQAESTATNGLRTMLSIGSTTAGLTIDGNLIVQGLYNVRETPLITQTWGFYQKGSSLTGNAWLNHAPLRDNNVDGAAGMVSPVDIVPYAISVSVEDDGSSSTDTGNVTFYVKCIGYTDPANSGLLKRSDLQNLQAKVINRGNCTISMGRNVTDYKVLTSPNLIPAGVSFGIYFTESITDFASEVVVKLFCTQY